MARSPQDIIQLQLGAYVIQIAQLTSEKEVLQEKIIVLQKELASIRLPDEARLNGQQEVRSN